MCSKQVALLGIDIVAAFVDRLNERFRGYVGTGKHGANVFGVMFVFVCDGFSVYVLLFSLCTCAQVHNKTLSII